MIKRIKNKSFHLLNRNENLRQLIVYLFIGGGSALTDLILLFIFVDLFNIYYLIAQTLSFTIVSTVAFFLHKKYTFRHKSKSGDKWRYTLFILIAGTGLLWSLFFLYLFVSVLNLHYLLAAVLVKFIVLVWNFLMNKFVTFRVTHEEEFIA